MSEIGICFILSLNLTGLSRFVLNGSFQIFFFLGDFSDDPHVWPHERNLVGIDGIFANRHIDHWYLSRFITFGRLLTACEVRIADARTPLVSKTQTPLH